MKMPDEIKKGLEYCGHQSRREVCHKCPFDVTMEDCIAWMASDALAYIQQLETKCHQLERERDAAVADLKYVAVCETCKEFHRSALTEPCIHCIKYGLLDSENKYEWRGVKEE